MNTIGRHSQVKPKQAHLPSRGRRIVFSIIMLVGVLLMLEAVSRLYLCRFDDRAWLHPERIIYHFYPEMKSLAWERQQESSDNAVEVLLLGGSVLNVEWGSIDALIAERLTWELRRPVRVHNLTAPAHTTRDSLLKYKRIGDDPFDLVVVYHGINEMRTNNAPSDVFRDDYGHYSWYRFVNAIDRDRWLPFLALPYFAKHAAIVLQGRFGWSKVIPTSDPRPDWLEHGLNVKSARSFRENLSAILDLAESREEPVMLMTFASHLAEGYSEEAFRALELDYTRHRSPLRWWGTPEAVAAGIEAHNAVIRDLAATRRILFVDQAALIPGERRIYNDVCHLTVSGSELFVDNMMDTLRAVAETTGAR